MGYFLGDCGNLLRVIMWRVAVFLYRRFGKTYRDHLQQSACTDIDKN